MSTVNRIGLGNTFKALMDAVEAQGLKLGNNGWHDDSPINPEMFDRVHDWIEDRCSASKGGWSAEHSSYRLKHICEAEIEGGYCSNGAFIAACLFAGFTALVEPDSPNCYFTGPYYEEE